MIPDSGFWIVTYQDRYGGAYSDGAFVAFHVMYGPGSCGIVDERGVEQGGDGVAHRMRKMQFEADAGDRTAEIFWALPPDWVAVGASREEAILNLQKKIALLDEARRAAEIPVPPRDSSPSPGSGSG